MDSELQMMVDRVWRRMLRLVRPRLWWDRGFSDQPPRIVSTPWRTFPRSTTAQSHLFAVGDVHGCADLLSLLLTHLCAQPHADGTMRSIVFLGDLIDRGPGSIRSLHLAQGCAERFDCAVILPGNHEAALLKALNPADDGASFRLWLEKGGDTVLREIGAQRLPVLKQRAAVREALPAGVEEQLRASPGHLWDGDLLLVHAGIDPHSDRSAFLAQGVEDVTPEVEHWSTIREPFLSWRGGWDGGRAPGPTLVVHGHSPVTKSRLTGLDQLLARADLAESHARINLDLGSTRSGTVGAVEAIAGQYRIHIARYG